MKNVFISYSRSDSDLAFSLAAEIELLGYSVWIDREIGGGQNWWVEIISAIRDSDVLVFCVSEASLASEICRIEFDYAVSLGKQVLPISLVDIDIVHPILADRHIIAFLSADYGHRKDVAKALLATPSSSPVPSPEPEPPQLPAMPLIEISRRLRTAVLTLEEQEDILRSLVELLTKRTRVSEVKLLAAEFRRHASVALRVATELDRILRISPTCITEERKELASNWSINLNAPCKSIVGLADGSTLTAVCKDGQLFELGTEGGERIRSVNLDIFVNDMDISEDDGIAALAGSKRIVLRSNLATRDPFGNTYEHTVGIGRVNGLVDTTQGYNVSLAEDEDAGSGKDPEDYKDRNVIFSIAGPTGQLAKEIPPFRVVSLDTGSERVAFGLDDGTVLIWSLRWHRSIARIELPNGDSVRALRFIDEFLFVGDYQGCLYKLDRELNVHASACQQNSAICEIIADDGSGNLLTLTSDGQLTRHRPDDLAVLSTNKMARSCVSADAPSYGELAAIGHREGTISLVSLKSLATVASYKFLDGPVSAIFWSRNGEWIAAADDAKLVCVKPT